MLSFEADFPALTFDKKFYGKTFNRIMGEILRESVRVFLRTLLAHVPVETGMARATLIPIGQYLHNVGGLIFSPIRDPYFHKDEGGVISKDLGISRQSFQVVDDNMTNFVYSAYWDSGTTHYFIQGYYNNQPKSLPGWVAIPLAEQAMIQFFNKTVLRRIPDLGDYIN